MGKWYNSGEEETYHSTSPIPNSARLQEIPLLGSVRCCPALAQTRMDLLSLQPDVPLLGTTLLQERNRALTSYYLGGKSWPKHGLRSCSCHTR
jgi:hypothetical protein